MRTSTFIILLECTEGEARRKMTDTTHVWLALYTRHSRHTVGQATAVENGYLHVKSPMQHLASRMSSRRRKTKPVR